MEWLTANNLIAAGLVLMGVCGMINLVGATIDRLRKWRKPQEDMVASLVLMPASCSTMSS